jgi:hypothetical protein
MMDVLVDLSFHVRALIRALFNLILLRIASENKRGLLNAFKGR